MKVIKAFGGLGNQMFQYAFYLYVKENNSDTVFDVRDYDIHSYHSGFELTEIFGITAERLSDREIKSISLKQENLLVRALRRYCGLRLSKNTEVYENKEYTFVPFRAFYSDVVLRGNWQDVNYILPVEEKVRTAFEFPRIVSDKNTEVKELIQSCNSVSIHVRRGDYLMTSNLGGVVGAQYYRGAIEYIIKNVISPVFFIFSDDIEWCKTEFNDLCPIFIDWNKGNQSYIDMQLISLCKHNIIANSSFSWWGAWLNQNPGKIVIMPQQWDTECKENKLVWNGWQTI